MCLKLEKLCTCTVIRNIVEFRIIFLRMMMCVIVLHQGGNTVDLEAGHNHFYVDQGHLVVGRGRGSDVILVAQIDAGIYC